MKSYHLANLSKTPTRILVGNGDLTEEKREWTQPAEYWTLIYYEHQNAVTQQNQTTLVSTGDVVVFAPSVRCGHGRVGSDTPFQYFTFDLPGLTGSLQAIPRILPQMERYYGDLRQASSRITDSAIPAIAFVWGFMWNVSESRSKHRRNDSLYAAEAFIRQNLRRKFSMTELAEVTQFTTRHLLRLFRQEHDCTVQEYVRQVRVQEATRLLLETSQPIKQIATNVGILDLQEFNKLIRSATGASPTAYRSDGRPM